MYVPFQLTWPLPALLAWALSWVVFIVAHGLGLAMSDAAALATLTGVLLSLLTTQTWRRLFVGLGFPASLWLMQGAALPSWIWLLPLLMLVLLYPLRAWKDAPLFPTPPDALNDLPELAPLEPGARVLDAGCGLGHGLDALRQAYPLAQLHGIEWSRPLAWWCARRCPWARIQRGDYWQLDWSQFDLVYLFQRPETMLRAFEKAGAELGPAAYLVSLEFTVPGVTPWACIEAEEGKPVWIYTGEQFRAAPADPAQAE